MKQMTKEEILKYAKANNACKRGMRRFRYNEPLAYEDLRWALEHNLDLGYEVYLRAVKKYGLSLQHVPEKHRTYELCMVATKQCRLALGLVPEKFRQQVKEKLAPVPKGISWVLKY